jgi:hypothetical protein
MYVLNPFVINAHNGHHLTTFATSQATITELAANFMIQIFAQAPKIIILVVLFFLRDSARIRPRRTPQHRRMRVFYVYSSFMRHILD